MLATAESSSYRSYLQTKQTELKRRIEALPEGKVRGQFETVFNGLAVLLRPEDVPLVRQLPEVEEVTASISYRKALDEALPLSNVPSAWNHPGIGGEENAGVGIKIGIIDTGIDITHPMFQDPSLTPPGGFPRFTEPTLACLKSDERFTNRKIIVARNYISLLGNPDPNCDAEDRDGHGSFVAAAAAGRRATAPLASIAGVAPKAFLGSYKVFGTPGTNDTASVEALLKAIDDAVNDGMDVINLSVGAPTNNLPQNDLLSQAVATAVASGVTVVVAAGNEGPGTGTIVSPGISPAAITVGSASNARLFAHLLTVSAPAPVPPELATIAAVPGNGPEITSPVGPASLLDVASLDPTGIVCSSLPGGSLIGKMALIQRGGCNFSVKIRNAFQAGAIAALIYNNQRNQPAISMNVEAATQIPAVMIGNREGIGLREFLAAAGAGAEALLGGRLQAIPMTPNQMAGFSARGPSTDFGIKPDLVAPGTNVYSATQRAYPSGEQFDPSGFGISSGTSFSVPIVAGAAALVKQVMPQFTPNQIKSALVNTAVKQVSSSQGGMVGVLARGNGLLDLAAALNTPVTVSPTSISFGANPPGGFLLTSVNLNVTNVGAARDTFEVSVNPAMGSGKLTLTAFPSQIDLAAGATMSLTILASAFEPLHNTVEGYLAIQSQNTQRTITVSYWGTFLQPTVNSGGVVNAAGFTSSPASIAARSLVSIFGTQMTNDSELASILPLPKSAGGARVTIGNIEAPILYASPNQINAQVPVELEGRTQADVVVHLNGVSSAPRALMLSPASPGIFTVNQSGTGAGAILHASDSSPVTSANPARPDEVVEVFATGLGPTSPSVATGQPASITPLATTQIVPTATIAGIAAPVRFSGLAPFFVGLYKITVEVPRGIPAGALPLILTASGQASNPVTIFVGN